MCGQERRVPGAMSPCWHGSLDLAGLTYLIWLFGLHSTGRTLHIQPTYELGVGLPVYRSKRRAEEAPNSSSPQSA